MNILIISIIVFGLILIIFGIRKILFTKEKTVEILPQPRKIKVELFTIQKSKATLKNDNKPFNFDISTISFKENEIETLVTLYNNSSKHIRLEFLEAYFTIMNQRFEGDHKLRELTMGTNDIILKNTILSQQTLIRNIYFKDIKPEDFTGETLLTIRLMINDEKIILKKSINNSSIKQLQLFNES